MTDGAKRQLIMLNVSIDYCTVNENHIYVMKHDIFELNMHLCVTLCKGLVIFGKIMQINAHASLVAG